jgi:hypothetical protein
MRRIIDWWLNRKWEQKSPTDFLLHCNGIVTIVYLHSEGWVWCAFASKGFLLLAPLHVDGAFVSGNAARRDAERWLAASGSDGTT